MSAFFRSHQNLLKKIAKISHSIIDFLFYIFASLVLFIFALNLWQYNNCSNDIIKVFYKDYIHLISECMILYTQ